MDDDATAGFAYPANLLIIVTIYFFVITFVGIVGNLLVILIYLKNKTINDQVLNIFTVNMAILDILASLNLILVIYSLAKGNQWTLGFVACQIQGSIISSLITASLFNILAISVNRYIKICRINRLHWMNSQRNIKITVILVWILPIPFSTFNMVMGNWNKYDPFMGTCFTAIEKGPKFMPVIALIMYMGIVGGLTFSYYKISKKILENRPSQSKVQTKNLHSSAAAARAKRNRK